MSESISKITSLLRSLLGGSTEPKNRVVTAIVLAGGIGSRMQGENGITKQRMELCSRPILAHTVQAFQDSDAVRHIVIVSRPEECALVEGWKEQCGWDKVTAIVCGGAERSDSALCGFKAIPDDTEVVLIHDGARCLVTHEIIERVARAALVHGAAIAAERVSSTVKQSDGKGFVASTIDRSTVYLAQTPQGFLTEVYRAAAYLHLDRGGAAVTDDASLCEESELPVKLVECGEENLKITTPRDLHVARAILAEREEKQAERAEAERRTAADRAQDRAKRREARNP